MEKERRHIGTKTFPSRQRGTAHARFNVIAWTLSHAGRDAMHRISTAAGQIRPKRMQNACYTLQIIPRDCRDNICNMQTVCRRRTHVSTLLHGCCHTHVETRCIASLQQQHLNRTESRSATVKNKVEILPAVMFEHPVGTDKREAFRNCLGDDEAVGRVVVSGNERQMCKGVEVFFLYIINRVAQLFPGVPDNVFRRFPMFKTDSAVLKQVDGFLYAFGTDVNHVFTIIENITDVPAQRTIVPGSIKHKDVRINQVSHTAYFITARRSIIFIAGPFSFSHKAAFDSFFGGTYGVSSFLPLAFFGDAGLDAAFSGAVTLDAFVVMTVLFYNYKCKGITFPVFRKRNFISSVAVARTHGTHVETHKFVRLYNQSHRQQF
jgi:hypothetical protein